MKHLKLLFSFTLLIGITHLTMAGEYTFTSEIEINEIAINRFLAKQYSDASFTKNWNDIYAGNPYSMSISRPVVILKSNSIVLEIGVTLNNKYYLLTPALTISPFTITSADIKATFTQLQTYLNTVQRITNQWEKDLINQKLNAIQWQINQGKLLTEPNSLTNYAQISTSFNSITTTIADGKISLAFSFKNQTIRPGYLLIIYENTDHDTYVRLNSNTLLEPQQFILYNKAGGLITEIDDFSQGAVNHWINESNPYKYNFDFIIQGGGINLSETIAKFFVKRGDGVVGIEAKGWYGGIYQNDRTILGE